MDSKRPPKGPTLYARLYLLIAPDGVVLLEASTLLPELGEDAAEKVHRPEGLLGQLHVGVDLVHALLELLQLLSLERSSNILVFELKP